MSSSSEYETVSVEIYGIPMRVRVPVGEASDVHRAAKLVRERIEQLRKPADLPERALIRAALEIAYESFARHRGLEQSLQRLLLIINEGLDDSAS